MQDRRQFWLVGSIGETQGIKIEGIALPEPDNENPLPMLWHPELSVDNSMVDCIAKLFLECLTDDPECITFVMADKVFDILQQNDRWSMKPDNLHNVVEQGSLCLALKAMRTP